MNPTKNRGWTRVLQNLCCMFHFIWLVWCGNSLSFNGVENEVTWKLVEIYKWDIGLAKRIVFSLDSLSIHLAVDEGLLLTRNKVFIMVKLKPSLWKFYGRYHELVNCYAISALQMMREMFLLSLLPYGSFLIHDLSLGV